jgi:hypothetical protein
MGHKVFWSFTQYKYGKNNSRYPKLKSGEVYILFRAKDVREVMQAIDEDFFKMDLDITEVEFIEPYDNEIGWSDEETNAQFSKLYAKAKESKEIVYDRFCGYETYR